MFNESKSNVSLGTIRFLLNTSSVIQARQLFLFFVNIRHIFFSIPVFQTVLYYSIESSASTWNCSKTFIM